MKIIVTKEQKKVINEALGVPKHILDVAEKMYQIVLRDLKSITEKQNEYEFDGVTYFDLGDKKQIPIRSYTLTVEVDETDQVEDGVILGSMGMGQQFRFDRGIMMRLNAESNEANFHVQFYANEDWEPKDLVEWFENNRTTAEGSLAHELKHKYDHQVNRTGLIGNEAQYIAHQGLPNVRIPEVDDQFYRYLYFTDAMESSVRATEVASNIRTQGIKKSEFRDFLKNNRTFKIMMEIKNFTFEKLIRGVYENLDSVDRIFDMIDVDTEGMSDKDKVKKMLELIYVNIANKKIEVFDEYLDRGNNPFNVFLRQLGGIVDEDDIKVDQIKKNFRNFVAKYENNPLGFFKAEIDKFHRVSDQIIRKIGKLYDMAQDDTQVTESIIDWELHMKLQQKKRGNRPLDTEYKYKKILKEEVDLTNKIKDSLKNKAIVENIPYNNFRVITEDTPWFTVILFPKYMETKVKSILSSQLKDIKKYYKISSIDEFGDDDKHIHGSKLYKNLLYYTYNNRKKLKRNETTNELLYKNFNGELQTLSELTDMSIVIFFTPEETKVDDIKKLYHVTYSPDVENSGIKLGSNVKYSDRVYLWGDLSDAIYYGNNSFHTSKEVIRIYEVNVDGMDVYKDFEEPERRSFYVKNNIPISSIKLVEEI